ncbi:MULTISPECIES: hypothetical protein [unclassified Calothrix]|nr:MULTISPECIES: hypothetical protein [unclassified Calothrix]
MPTINIAWEPRPNGYAVRAIDQALAEIESALQKVMPPEDDET